MVRKISRISKTVKLILLLLIVMMLFFVYFRKLYFSLSAKKESGIRNEHVTNKK